MKNKFDADPELLLEFVDESLASLEQLDNMLVALEARPGDKEHINAIFRPVHTIKGNSTYFGLMDTKTLSHRLEDVLDLIRGGKLFPSPPVINALLKGVDELRGILQRVRQKGPEVPERPLFEKLLANIAEAQQFEIKDPAMFGLDFVKDLTEIRGRLAKNGPDYTVGLIELDGLITRMETAFSGFVKKAGNDDGRRKTAPRPSSLVALDEMADLERIKRNETGSIKAIETAFEELKALAGDEKTVGMVKQLHENFFAIYRQLGTDIVLKNILQSGIQELDAHGRWEAERPVAGTAANAPAAQSDAPEKSVQKTMRVSEESIDGFLNYVGELVIMGEMFEYLQKRILDTNANAKIISDFRGTNNLFKALSHNLQKSIMEIRKVPLTTLLQKAPRIVRDIGNALGKEITVTVTGDRVEIDKSLIEVLEAPFVHLVRNAADHGIETPDVRQKQGKARAGKIEIAATEKAGNIVLSIKDDGKGLDYGAIRRKAVAMGLIREDAEVSEETLKDFIFLSGLSTSEKVTDVSGRGVGMDVVKRSIESVGGRLSIDSRPDGGTEFSILLPESIYTQIIDGFVSVAGGEYYVFPLETVQETFRILPEDCKTVTERGQCVLRRGELIPLTSLDGIFKGALLTGKDVKNHIGIVLNRRKTKKVVCVDKIIGVQQVVLKKILGLTVADDLFTGGALMGDGRIAMVLDVEKLN
ncbi:MAG: chemotaxis protein CheA [Fibrobacterota bacterium]